jgi:hypothetical protein
LIYYSKNDAIDKVLETAQKLESNSYSGLKWVYLSFI